MVNTAYLYTNFYTIVESLSYQDILEKIHKTVLTAYGFVQAKNKTMLNIYKTGLPLGTQIWHHSKSDWIYSNHATWVWLLYPIQA